ncbi:MAG: type II toxin-antitoxin system HicB family antitoxin [Phycisphaerales bacterium]|nr:type II toxin-antitoxin system HicB family antitoxin [Phycisphaerales bacterium]
MKDYHINVFYSAEDKGYIADIPDLKYCSAWGKTPVAAVKQVMIAKNAWITSAKADGKRVPKPRYRPAIYQAAS